MFISFRVCGWAVDSTMIKSEKAFIGENFLKEKSTFERKKNSIIDNLIILDFARRNKEQIDGAEMALPSFLVSSKKHEVTCCDGETFVLFLV